MDLSFLDWISLIANIVTILGISGFLNDYLNKRKDEKKISNDVLSNAIKLASLSLDIYDIKEQKIYRASDYIKVIKTNLEEWKDLINNFEINRDWQQEEKYNLPDTEEHNLTSTEQYNDGEEYMSTDYVFCDGESQQCLYEEEIQDYINNFKKLSKNEQENILKIAIYNDIFDQHWKNFEGDLRLSESIIRDFVDAILLSITSEGLTYNAYLNSDFETLRVIQIEIDELLKYIELYVNSNVKYAIALKNPFIIFQEKWKSNHNLPIKFSMEDYAIRRLSIIEKLLLLLDKIDSELPK